MRSKEISRSKSDPVAQVSSILAGKKLTLYQVSRRSDSLYGRSSLYFIPHNLYYELRRGAFTPSIYHLAALSRISGYRLSHWMRVFGFDLENIARLQAILPSNRTILLDSSLIDSDTPITSLRSSSGQNHIPDIAPLSQLLEFGHEQRAGSLLGINNRRFLYAKIGHQDTLAFPDLLPGSIVRINSEAGSRVPPSAKGPQSNSMFLIQHSKGLSCCRLRSHAGNILIPVSTKLPYGQVELRYPGEVRILGVADLEIRTLTKATYPDVPADLAKRWEPRLLESHTSLSRLLRRARAKMNLSLHAASALSQRIAVLLADERYFVSPSSLSDYEAADTPPRLFHKTMSLCALYGLRFNDLLTVLGILDEHTGTEAMPPQFVAPGLLADPQYPEVALEPTGFLKRLFARSLEIPFFLRKSVSELTDLPDPSLEDFFWIDGEKNPLHPFLARGLVAVLNRRKKRPFHFRSKPLWQQPVYLLQKRDGTYICACCSIEDNSLVVHPYPQQRHLPMQFRNHQDAEVVGQVVTIARQLL